MGFYSNYYINHHPLCTGIYGFHATPWLPGPLSSNHAGILNAVAHQDVQVPSGTDFYLPEGDWYVTQNYEGDGWGLTLVFAHANNHGQLCFMHMNEIGDDLSVGTLRKSGHHIGKSGGIPGVAPGVTSTFSEGAHLHIAYDLGIKDRVYQHYGKPAFVAGGAWWEYGGYERSGGNTFRRGNHKEG